MATRLGVALALGLIVAIFAHPAAAAPAGTRVIRDGVTIILQVPIAFQVLDKKDLDPRPAASGSGKMLDPVTSFEGAAYSWNEAFQQYRYRHCFEFFLDLSFDPVVTGIPNRNPISHAVYFNPENDYNDYRAVGPGDPFQQSLWGFWGWGPPVDRFIAAFIGLGENVTTVDQQVIDRLGDRVARLIELPKECLHAQVSIDGTTDEVTAAHHFHSTFHADVEGWAATADDGTVAGSASVAYASYYTDKGECRGNKRDDASGGGSDLVIAGRRDGDHVELAVTGEIAVSGRLRSNPGAAGNPWTTLTSGRRPSTCR